LPWLAPWSLTLATRLPSWLHRAKIELDPPSNQYVHFGFQQKLQNRTHPQTASGGQVRGHTVGGGGQEMQLLSADTFGPPDSRTTFAISSRTNTNSLPTSFLYSPLIIRVSPLGYEC
jgi:hypothetical protein